MNTMFFRCQATTTTTTTKKNINDAMHMRDFTVRSHKNLVELGRVLNSFCVWGFLRRESCKGEHFESGCTVRAFHTEVKGQKTALKLMGILNKYIQESLNGTLCMCVCWGLFGKLFLRNLWLVHSAVMLCSNRNKVVFSTQSKIWTTRR